MRHTTNCLLIRNMPHTEVLLGQKKRGFGQGYFVGVGGGIETGETAAQGAARELWEEIGISGRREDLDHVARIAYYFPAKPEWNHFVEVFLLSSWRGEPQDRDELAPVWFPVEQIPYDAMWDDARHWLPPILNGRRIFCTFTFKPDNAAVAEMLIKDWSPDTPSYQELIQRQCIAYDRSASGRDSSQKAGWKLVERENFLQMLQMNGFTRLLEVGAGTGQDGLFFQQQGLDIICTDPSAENIRRCEEKGLIAYQMDFLSLDFPPASFDAVYALNCLLHVPNPDLPLVLNALHRVLKPGGLFYLGVYGGVDWEGIWQDDPSEPKRFFAYRSDETIRDAVRKLFYEVYFRPIPVEGDRKGYFQSFILSKPPDP